MIRPDSIKKTALLASTAVALIGASSPALATDWTGATSNDWSNGANWSGGTPAAGVDAVVDVTSPHAPNIAGGITADTAQLFIGQSATGALTVSRGSLTAYGALWLGYNAGAEGTLRATGAASQIDAGALLLVGYDGAGVFSLSHGADFNGVGAFLGANSADSKGSLALNGAGTTFNLSGDLLVGMRGTGTLAITNGATFIGSEFRVGVYAGAVGTATVDGAGSSLAANSSLIIGDAGSATLNIRNGAVVSGGGGIGAHIGYAATGSGTVNVDGAQLIANLSVGYAGIGVLNITNGGTVDTGSANLELGFQSGSSGTATVSGAGSTLNAYGVYVGYNGTGVLTVSNGGAVTATDFYVGGDSSNNGDGTVNIGAASGRAAGRARPDQCRHLGIRFR